MSEEDWERVRLDINELRALLAGERAGGPEASRVSVLSPTLGRYYRSEIFDVPGSGASLTILSVPRPYGFALVHGDMAEALAATARDLDVRLVQTLDPSETTLGVATLQAPSTRQFVIDIMRADWEAAYPPSGYADSEGRWISPSSAEPPEFDPTQMDHLRLYEAQRRWTAQAVEEVPRLLQFAARASVGGARAVRDFPATGNVATSLGYQRR